ncbi:hypothetical protein D3C76_855840 [compost metagenome]
MQAEAGVGGVFLDARQQAVGGHALVAGARLVAGFQHLAAERLQRVGGEEQGDLGARLQGDGVGHRELDAHRRPRRVGHLHDAFAGDHRFAQPVVGVAVHRHAVPRRQHPAALQLRAHRRQFGAALFGAAGEQGQLVAALRVVEGALAGGEQLGVGHRHFAAEHLGAVAQGGLVQLEQRRAGLHRLVRPHQHVLDHPVDG